MKHTQESRDIYAKCNQCGIELFHTDEDVVDFEGIDKEIITCCDCDYRFNRIDSPEYKGRVKVCDIVKKWIN